MKVLPTSLPEVVIIEPEIFRDSRGFFMESYNQRDLDEAGLHAEFVQDNHSLSKEAGVLLVGLLAR